jgi:hypothetical protein
MKSSIQLKEPQSTSIATIQVLMAQILPNSHTLYARNSESERENSS